MADALGSGQLQGGNAGRVVFVCCGDGRRARLAFVLDRESCLDTAWHPDADEAVVVGLPGFIDEHLAVVAGEGDPCLLYTSDAADEQ